MSEIALPAPGAGRTEYSRAQTEDTALERHGFTFSGSAAEYFRVWIVNIALSVVTVGIYSAWAKVRNKQYFYGNSQLAGSSFQYTANPLNILKGRLIVVLSFIAYNVASTLEPFLAGAIVLLLIPLVPWMVVNAVRFNHRHSAYRNLRFHFDAKYWEAFRVYVLLTLAIGLSFGLAYPFVAWRRKQFIASRSRFGNGAFSYHAEIGYFYLVYVVAGIIYAGVLTGLFVVLSGTAVLFGPEMAGELTAGADANVASKLATMVFLAIAYLGFFAAFVVFNTAIQAAIANYSWSNTRLDDIRFELRLSLPRIIWLQLTNLLAIILSLGLLIPWAKVRMTGYRLSCFTMFTPRGDLERFVAARRGHVTATGEEFGEALDLDLGL